MHVYAMEYVGVCISQQVLRSEWCGMQKLLREIVDAAWLNLVQVLI